MFSIAHGKFQDLIYITVIFLGISLAVCVIFAFLNTFIIKSDDLWPRTSLSFSSFNNNYHPNRYRYHHPNGNGSRGSNKNGIFFNLIPCYTHKRYHIYGHYVIMTKKSYSWTCYNRLTKGHRSHIFLIQCYALKPQNITT